MTDRSHHLIDNFHPLHRSSQSRRARRATWPARLGTLALAACQLWSLGLAGTAQAVTFHPPVDPGHTRALTPDEMRHIEGSQIQQHQQAVAIPNAGDTYPWETSVNNTNTANGNKTISLPLVGWTARGGQPVALTLNHNSQGNHNSELGHKWTFSYDIYVMADTNQMEAPGEAVHWGDDLSEFYIQSGSTYTAPTGIHDTLVQNVDSTWTLTKPDQTKYHFNTAGYCDTITDENGNVITINHNSGNFVTSVVDPNGRTITLAYDSSSRIHTVTDPLSRVWTLTYNASNALTEVDWPALSGTTYSVFYGYNSTYDITSIKDPRGNTRALTYNSSDGLATEADNAGNASTFSYSSSATTVTDANGHATVYTYDSSGRVSQVTDPAGASEYYAYDSSNNKTQVEDKRGYYWNYTYNTVGDQLTAKDPLLHTTTNTFNSHHKLLTMALSGGESVSNTYDSSDNLTNVAEKNASGTTLATTVYTIGSYGLISSKLDADNHTTSYGYDTNGDLANTTTPLGSETQWFYNGLGVLTSREDALGRTTSDTLDGWERVTTATYPDSSTKTFTYDANSNLTQFVDATGTTTQTYDSDNRPLSESKGGTTVVSHTYDATGKKGLLSTTTDSGGRVITDAYTNRDQLYTVAETAGTTTYTYDAAGEQIGLTNANGTTVANVYDSAGRLTSVTNASSAGTTLSSFTYAYNSDDKRTSCTEANGDVVSYGYDGLLHLSSESRTGAYAYTATYTVDGVGNRTAQTVGGTSSTFTYNADDELTAVSGGLTRSYAYNANGDQTSRTVGGTTTPLGYDYDDQMTLAGGTTYTYDAGGRRVSRTAGSTTTSFQYDGGSVLLEKQGTTTTATYAYGNALLRKDGETPLFDGLGSERMVTNSSQSTTGSLTLSAFGGTVASSGSSTSSYMYGATSGYRSEGDTGLVKVGCRYYDPEVGRFTTRDTDLDEAPYVYCDSDPVNMVDEDGHAPKAPGPKKPGPKKPTPIPYPWPGIGPVKITSGGGVAVHGGLPVAGADANHNGSQEIPIDGEKYWPVVPYPEKLKLKNGPFAAYLKYIRDKNGI